MAEVESMKSREARQRGVTKMSGRGYRAQLYHKENGQKGVSRMAGRGYRAQIYRNGKLTSLGNYKTEESAADAYNMAVQKHEGGEGSINLTPATPSLSSVAATRSYISSVARGVATPSFPSVAAPPSSVSSVSTPNSSAEWKALLCNALPAGKDLNCGGCIARRTGGGYTWFIGHIKQLAQASGLVVFQNDLNDRAWSSPGGVWVSKNRIRMLPHGGDFEGGSGSGCGDGEGGGCGGGGGPAMAAGIPELSLTKDDEKAEHLYSIAKRCRLTLHGHLRGLKELPACEQIDHLQSVLQCELGNANPLPHDVAAFIKMREREKDLDGMDSCNIVKPYAVSASGRPMRTVNHDCVMPQAKSVTAEWCEDITTTAQASTVTTTAKPEKRTMAPRLSPTSKHHKPSAPSAAEAPASADPAGVPLQCRDLAGDARISRDVGDNQTLYAEWCIRRA